MTLLAPTATLYTQQDAHAYHSYYSAGDAIVSAARWYSGVPYIWNGYWSGFGLDCSELTSLAYWWAKGVWLGDDPHYQMQSSGYWVSTPRAGDLVFFSEDYSGYATHVGIATGQGTLIHASSYAGYVTETPISYLSGYIGAKRL